MTAVASPPRASGPLLPPPFKYGGSKPVDFPMHPSPHIDFPSSPSYKDIITGQSEMARQHTKKTVLHCSFVGCNKAFAKACKLQDHERSHTGERPFACDAEGCGKDFKRKDHLQRHQRSHAPRTTGDGEADAESSRPFQCTVLVSATSSTSATSCDRRFLTRQHLTRHIREYHDQSTSCDEEEKMKTQGGPTLAKQSRARARRPATYVCEIDKCAEAFTKRKLLRAHITVVHSDRTKVADKDIDVLEAQRMARLPFPCTASTCQKRFATNSKRMAHVERRHNNVPGYVCVFDHSQDGTPNGFAQFTTWSALQAHQRECHRPTCEQCGKQFKESRNLRQHMQRIHDRATGIQSDQDGSMTFSGDTDLHNDYLTSDGNSASLPCPHDECSRSFHSHRALRRHESWCGKGTEKRGGVTTQAGDEADVSENETDLESNSDVDDDFYRCEGGAVPEHAADRSKTLKRSWRDVDEDDVQTVSLSSLISAKYAQGEGRESSVSRSASSVKKRRLRGRVLGCPWKQVCRLRDNLAADENQADHVSCSYRFSRLYDIQRHLRSEHKVNLAHIDIQALLFDEEQAQLGEPRHSTQIAKELQSARRNEDH